MNIRRERRNTFYRSGMGGDVGAGANLGKVFADILRGVSDIVAERAGIASLAGALTEEFTWNVRRI